MPSIFRNSPFLTPILLIIAGAVLGVLHNRALDAGRPSLVQDVIRTALLPGELGFRGIFVVGDQAVRLVKSRSALLRENAVLRRRVSRLERENALLHEAAAESSRLRRMIGLTRALCPGAIAADVIARNESNWFDTATLDRGSRAGVEDGSAVIDERGLLVGQIVQTDPFTSQVVALSDSSSSSAVGAMVRRSRSVGIIQGQGADNLVLSYLPADADVRVGDVVISSGRARVVPKGLVIGQVVKVMRMKAVGTTSALVKPSARFDEIESVLIIRPGQAIVQ